MINNKGYGEGEPHSNSIHRQVAYVEIYLKNRRNYPLPFSNYIVHHKDREKLNNAVFNLQIMTEKEHDKLHKYIINNKIRYIASLHNVKLDGIILRFLEGLYYQKFPMLGMRSIEWFMEDFKKVMQKNIINLDTFLSYQIEYKRGTPFINKFPSYKNLK